MIKLREVLGKHDYTGMAFVGIRAAESTKRSEYDFESRGMKHKGQYSANPILNWASYEIWLHIYANSLFINRAYTKGSKRAGCLCCPMGGSKSDFFQYSNYQKEIDVFARIIAASNGRQHVVDEEYIANGGWNARKNGVNLGHIDITYQERIENGQLIIEVSNPRTNWREWIKTLGDIQEEEDRFILYAPELTTEFKFIQRPDGYEVRLPVVATKESPVFGKYFRQVFRKAAYCLGCRTCEANCKYNCISFDDDLIIKECARCRECHEIPVGCLAYHSLRIPNGGGKMKSINCFATHMAKTEWFKDFFYRKNEFLVENSLGPVQKRFFRRFLRDAELIIDSNVTPLTEKLDDLEWDSVTSLGIILSNIAYNPQFKWYITHMTIGRLYSRNDLTSMLEITGVTRKNAPYIINGFKRIVRTPFGLSLNFGYVDSAGSYGRTKCRIGSPVVILYSLYKFAEACGDYHEFTVNRLLNHNIDSDGISPTQIFGIEEDEMKRILLGLTASHPDYINAKLTHDLAVVSLNSSKTASDVLSLL